MYLRKVEIKNIRSIEHFTLTFEPGKEAGWHVLIGDNGTGKTSILRAIALGLIGPHEILRIDPDWYDWLSQDKEDGKIRLSVTRDYVDKRSGRGANRGSVDESREIPAEIRIEWQDVDDPEMSILELDHSPKSGKYAPERHLWGTAGGWFSCGFGALRRFVGGDQSLNQHFIRNPRIGAHLSLLKSEVALAETLVWMKDIYTRAEAENSAPHQTIQKGLYHFINKVGLLPQGYQLHRLSADGAFVKTPNGAEVHLYELSEGIRSVLSLALELIRLLLKTYNVEYVFNNMLDDNPDNDFVPCVGVVLIDEIDAHLHPTWQVRIGQWFTKYFPKLQFIVTTHSPLICRAAENGSVWRLAAPGSDEPSRQITGTELDRLIYGNVLDAYGTEVFGENITSSDRATEMRQRLAQLSKKSMKGTISAEESQELQQIKSILPTGG